MFLKVCCYKQAILRECQATMLRPIWNRAAIGGSMIVILSIYMGYTEEQEERDLRLSIYRFSWLKHSRHYQRLRLIQDLPLHPARRIYTTLDTKTPKWTLPNTRSSSGSPAPILYHPSTVLVPWKTSRSALA